MRGLRVGYVTALVWLLAAGLGPVQADLLTTGNILVSDEVFSGPGRIREFTPGGGLVQTFTFATPGQPRDLIVDSNGNVAIYNGTFTPVLTTLAPGSGTVLTNTPFAGWSTVNNITYGGIAAFGEFVFVTDMATAGAGSPNGIIRFNINDQSGVRFASGPANGPGDYIDLTLGRDGLLYAQFPGTSPGGNQVDVYDPTTLEFIRRINLGIDRRAIAVDANGDIFSVAFNDPRIFHYDRDGNVLRTVNPMVGGFTDIDIDGDGRIVASAGSTILLTDRSLSSFTTFNPGTTGITTFVAFVQPSLGPNVDVIPEPASMALLALGLAGLAGYAWRRRKQLAIRRT